MPFPIRRLLFAAALVCAAVPASAQSSAVNIVPTRIDAPAGAQNASITITNNASRSEIYQVSLFAWHQENGQDQLVPSHDVVAYPPVVPLEAGQTKVIRLGIKPAAEVDGRERSYRLVIDEVPQKANGSGAVQFVYRFSVPVFIAPPGKAGSDVQWSAAHGPDRRHVNVTLANDGSTHVLVQHVRFYGDFAGTALLSDMHVSADLLAGTKRTFTVVLPHPLATNTVVAEAVLDDNKTVKTSVTIAP